jgi:hypothetical protein
MEKQEYLYTSFPLKKCVLIPAMKHDPNITEYSFVSGFWLEHEVGDAHWNSASRHLKIRWQQTTLDAGREYSGAWGSMKWDGEFLQIKIRHAPEAN